MARLERVETLLAERTPVPSQEGHAVLRSPSPRHYPHMSFSPDHASHATAPMSLEPNQPVLASPVAPQPVDQSMERVAQPTRLQALFGRCLGHVATWRGGSYCRTAGSAGSQDEHAWARARDFDLFGPGPATVETYGDKRLVVDDSVHSGSVEARVTQLTDMVQELAKLVATSVASSSAQPLEGAAPGALAASSSQDALGSAGNPSYPEKAKSITHTPLK